MFSYVGNGPAFHPGRGRNSSSCFSLRNAHEQYVSVLYKYVIGDNVFLVFNFQSHSILHHRCSELQCSESTRICQRHMWRVNRVALFHCRIQRKAQGEFDQIFANDIGNRGKNKRTGTDAKHRGFHDAIRSKFLSRDSEYLYRRRNFIDWRI